MQRVLLLQPVALTPDALSDTALGTTNNLHTQSWLVVSNKGPNWQRDVLSRASMGGVIMQAYPLRPAMNRADCLASSSC